MTTTDTDILCPLGCKVESNPHGDYNGYPLRACSQCHFVFTTQRTFSSEIYEDIYKQPGVYRQMLETAEKTHRREMGFRELWWYKRMVLKWMDRFAVPRTLLDVGCGPGTFLLVARDRGWTVSGVELSREAGTRAQGFGLDVHVTTVQEYVGDHREAFGVVTCFEVLEHVSDPLDMLRAMKDALVPGGRLILSVPNLDDPYCLKQLIPSAMPPVHINFFNRSSVRRMFDAVGLEMVRFHSLPIPTSSVRNVEGKAKAMRVMPWLGLQRLVGRADGTTLIAMAQRSAKG